MSIFVTDRVAFKFGNASRRKYTDEGFLIVPGKAARTGIQDYLAIELGLSDRDPYDIVKVYRPEDEVFDKDSLASYLHTDVTNDHPTELVNADSYKDVSVGIVSSEGRKEGDYVVVDMIVKASDAIRDIESGKAELSAGYTAEYVAEQGTTKDGQSYDFIQRNIKINHVALVDRARAGHEAALFDHNKPQGKVTMPGTITLDGKAFEVADKNTATMIQTALDAKDEAIVKANKAASKKDATIDSLNDQIETLKSDTSDAAIQKLVAVRTSVIDGARKILGEAYDGAEKSLLDIKREACAKAFPKRDIASKDEAYIDVAFDQAMENEEEKKEKDEEDKKETSDSHQDLATAISNKKTTVKDSRESLKSEMSQRWKQTVGAK